MEKTEEAFDDMSNLSAPPQPPGRLIRQGAEARIYSVPEGYLSSFPGLACIVKERFVKTYRHPTLDASLSLRRMRAEARQLVKCRQIGLPVPALLLVNLAHRQLWIEDVCTPFGLSLGDWLQQILMLGSPREWLDEMARRLGQLLAKMHANSIIHGDLTTANILVQLNKAGDDLGNYCLYFIDFGLSSFNNHSTTQFRSEKIAVDLYVLERALISALVNQKADENLSFKPEAFFEAILAAYASSYPSEIIAKSTSKMKVERSREEKRPRCDGVEEVNGILRTLKEVEARGRKRLMIG